MQVFRRFYWWLLTVGIILLVTSASKINRAWLVPSGKIVINSGIYTASDGKFVALTFDDGPDSVYTPQVAQVLQHYGIKGTFMLVGRRAAGLPKVVKALVAAGNEIGNHSYSHPDMRTLSADAQRRQIERTNQILQNEGVNPRWFRPPYGSFNNATVRAASGLKMETILWSVDPRDWAQPGTKSIEARVLNNTGNAAVILLHSTNPQTVAALPHIIENLKSKGYSFLTLSEWHQAVSKGIWHAPAPLQTAPFKPAAEGTLPPLPSNPPGGLEMPMLDTLSNGKLQSLDESFHTPFGLDGEARIIDKLEAIRPASQAPTLAAALQQAFTEEFDIVAPPVTTQAAAGANIQAAVPGTPQDGAIKALQEKSFRDSHQAQQAQAIVQLRVFANFTNIEDLAAVLATQRGMTLQHYLSESNAAIVPVGQAEPVSIGQVASGTPAIQSTASSPAQE